jgi:hypothetical protein
MTREDGSLFSMAWGSFCFVAVGLMYGSVAFLLARWNVMAHQHPRDIRGVVALVAVAAWAGFWFALVGSPYLRRAHFTGALDFLFYRSSDCSFRLFSGCSLRPTSTVTDTNGPNQSMKPMPCMGNNLNVIAIAPCRGLSLSR